MNEPPIPPRTVAASNQTNAHPWEGTPYANHLAQTAGHLDRFACLRSARSTVVIALAIPTSLIGTFLLLNAMGRSLNVVSLGFAAILMGLSVALFILRGFAG